MGGEPADAASLLVEKPASSTAARNSCSTARRKVERGRATHRHDTLGRPHGRIEQPGAPQERAGTAGEGSSGRPRLAVAARAPARRRRQPGRALRTRAHRLRRQRRRTRRRTAGARSAPRRGVQPAAVAAALPQPPSPARGRPRSHASRACRARRTGGPCPCPRRARLLVVRRAAPRRPPAGAGAGDPRRWTRRTAGHSARPSCRRTPDAHAGTATASNVCPYGSLNRG